MEVATEDLRCFTILDVGLVLVREFGCQAKVNEGYLLSDLTLTFLEANHDVLWLEIVIHSPSRVHYLDTIQQLFAHGQDLLDPL